MANLFYQVPALGNNALLLIMSNQQVNAIEVEEEIRVLPTHDGALKLVIGIIARAAQDAKQGNVEALDWFYSDQFRRYCDYLGLNHSYAVKQLKQWLEKKEFKDWQFKTVSQLPDDERRRFEEERLKYHAETMAIYEQWQKTKLSIAQFCQREGYDYNTIKTRFYKLRRWREQNNAD